MKRDPNDKTVLRELLRGVYGTQGEWSDACRYALARGWSTDECQSVLFWCHPLMLIKRLAALRGDYTAQRERLEAQGAGEGEGERAWQESEHGAAPPTPAGEEAITRQRDPRCATQAVQGPESPTDFQSEKEGGMEYEVKLAFDPSAATWTAKAYDGRGQSVVYGAGFSAVKACEAVSQELERLRNAQLAQESAPPTDDSKT